MYVNGWYVEDLFLKLLGTPLLTNHFHLDGVVDE
jgi:hypothetical protein